jgi:hypothetical protein
MIDGEPGTQRTLRAGLLWLFVAGALGTGTELLLVDHTEDVWQRIPLLLLAASLIALGWRAAGRKAASLRVFRLLMGLFVVGGCIGLVLHFRANVEFERETHPALTGMRFFLAAIHGTAPPTLAPAGLCGLGALGWLYTLRHPGLGTRT